MFALARSIERKCATNGIAHLPPPHPCAHLSCWCSGARRARTVYNRIVDPVFRAAGVKTTVMETKYANHAQQLVEQLRLEDVEGIDGGRGSSVGLQACVGHWRGMRDLVDDVPRMAVGPISVS